MTTLSVNGYHSSINRKQVLEACVWVLTGGLAGKLLGVIHPVGGLIFGAGIAISEKLGDKVGDKVASIAGGHFGLISCIFSRCAVGAALSWILGYSMSLYGGVLLSVTTAVVGIVVLTALDL